MSLIESIFKGKVVELPKDVTEELIPGEQVLHVVRQARLEQPITPDLIIVTTERVMIRRPDWFGLTASNRDYRYEDMGNVTVKRGLLNSTVSVKMRMLSYDLILKAIPKAEAPKISSTIQKGIDGRFHGLDGKESRIYRNPRKVDVGSENQDLLKILKYRYVKGEITNEEYERIKKDISG